MTVNTACHAIRQACTIAIIRCLSLLFQIVGITDTGSTVPVEQPVSASVPVLLCLSARETCLLLLSRLYSDNRDNSCILITQCCASLPAAHITKHLSSTAQAATQVMMQPSYDNESQQPPQAWEEKGFHTFFAREKAGT